MLNKKDKTKKEIKCPFRKLNPCSEECAFYRKGVRFNELKNESFPFEECAVNIIADNLEAMHNRTYMLQKEVGETKHVMAIKIMADLGLVKNSEVERQVLRIISPPEETKLLK
jgi:hypothetical protein